MKNKNYLTLIRLILLGLSITLIAETSHSQTVIEKLRGKMLIKKITGIELSYNTDQYVPLSGTAIGLKIDATLKNGKKAGTGIGTKDNIPWENYTVEVEGGKFDPATGLLEITGNNKVTIIAKLTISPAISSQLLIEPLEIKEISLSQKAGENFGTFLVTTKATLSDNSTVDTENGKLPWSKLDVTAHGAEFNNGELSVNKLDYRDIKDDKLVFEAKVKGQADISASISIPLDYTGNITAYFSGSRGQDGQDGAAGASGAAGKAGSGERAGENGGNGLRGIDGGNGTAGADGENLEVYVGLTQNATTGNDLLKLHIKSLSSGKESFLKIDPTKGEFHIYAEGGKGGDGGDGGNGGYGGSGGGGTVSGKTGNGGNGANGGISGNGGYGGNVQVFVDPQAKKYMSSLIIHNNGGRVGTPGNAGSAGGCSSGCDSRGESGKIGNFGNPGAAGKVTITEKDVVFNW